MAENTLEGAKLFFRNGLQASYDKLTTKDAGTFYVTSDTHRLYLGSDLLSQAVLTVATANDLNKLAATDGQIAYVKDGNILAIKDGNNWTQLNPDTYVAQLLTAVNTQDSVAQITTQITDNKQTSLSTSFSITGANGATVSSNGTAVTVAVDQLAIGNTQSTNGIDLKLGSSNNKVTIKGAGDTKVTGGTDGITITTDAKDFRVTEGTISGANATSGFVIGGTLTLKDKAHTDSATSETVDLAAGTIDPIIAYGANGGSTAKFVNGTATLTTYTQKEIDDAIAKAKAQMDAMTYKGLLNKSTDLPTTKVQIGDTYMVAVAGTYLGDDKTYPKGTLIIAQGTEGGDGYITADTLEWDAVLTSDTDTTYTLQNLGNNQIGLVDAIQQTAASILSITGSTAIKATVAGDDKGNPTLTIAHADIAHTNAQGTTITQTAGSKQALSYISAVEVDNQGHVTKLTTTEASVTDTINSSLTFTTTGGAATLPTSETAVTIITEVKDNTETSVTDSFQLASSSLAIQGTNKKVSVDLVWGTF